MKTDKTEIDKVWIDEMTPSSEATQKELFHTYLSDKRHMTQEEFQTQYMCEFKLEAPLLICSASYDHAKYFVRNNLAPEIRWRYIHEPQQLRSMRDCTLLFVEDYWRAANLYEIEFEAKVSGMTVRYV